MGKLDIESTITDEDEFDTEADDEPVAGKLLASQKDARRRLEDRLDELRLNRQLREYDFRDI